MTTDSPVGRRGYSGVTRRVSSKKGSGTKSAKHPKGRSGYLFLTPF
jgi:hypothetical protein